MNYISFEPLRAKVPKGVPALRIFLTAPLPPLLIPSCKSGKNEAVSLCGDPISATDLAVSSNENMIAAWVEVGADGDIAWASYFEVDVGWSPPIELGLGYLPAVAINSTGHAVIAFFTSDSSDLFSMQYDPNIGWDAPASVSNSPSQPLGSGLAGICINDYR